MNIIRRGNVKKRRIAAVGMYDGVHPGHRFLIDFLRHEGIRRDMASAVVTFRSHPLTVVDPTRVPPMLTTLDQRVTLLDRAGVDDCIILDFDDRMRRMSAREFLSTLMKRFGVVVLVVGYNHRFGHNRAEGIDDYRRVGEEIGMEIVEAPEFKIDGQSVSSSIIRRLLREGNLNMSNRLLGRNYTLQGIVVSGKQLGRKLGFPTANIKPIPGVMIPMEGVYFAYCTTPDGEERPAVVNIGRCPTVDDDPEPPLSIEAHILNYSGFLYDDLLTIEFVHRHRDEQKFPNLDKLRACLANDVNRARKHFHLPR